jgi:hypothetical protein
MKRTVTISINELPLRIEQLTNDQISDLFGGCAEIHQPCQKDTDCCGDWDYCRGPKGGQYICKRATGWE